MHADLSSIGIAACSLTCASRRNVHHGRLPNLRHPLRTPPCPARKPSEQPIASLLAYPSAFLLLAPSFRPPCSQVGKGPFGQNSWKPETGFCPRGLRPGTLAGAAWRCPEALQAFCMFVCLSACPSCKRAYTQPHANDHSCVTECVSANNKTNVSMYE